MYVYIYKSFGSNGTYKNHVEGEVIGSKLTGCVCFLLIKIKNYLLYV